MDSCRVQSPIILWDYEERLQSAHSHSEKGENDCVLIKIMEATVCVWCVKQVEGIYI